MGAINMIIAIATIVNHSAQVSQDAPITTGDAVAVILLIAFLGASGIFVLRLYADKERYKSRSELLQVRVDHLEDSVLHLRSKTSTVDTKSPVINRCKTMILMAAQSNDEEARTAALLACRYIREHRLDIVKIT